MESVLAQNPDEYNSIKYQVDFPGWGDYTTEVGNRRGFYSINRIPRVEIDGGWDQNSLNLTQAVFDLRMKLADSRFSNQFQNNRCYSEHNTID